MPECAVRPTLSIGITTRNRPASLQRCVDSLAYLAHLEPEILVFDDGSDVPVARTLPAQPRLRIIRDAGAPGYIVGRNRLMAEASAGTVLLLDDDAALLEGAGVERALAILARDSHVAAIGFAQANADGSPWPESMQAAPGQSPRYVAAFIGFAHMLRRDVFLSLGGYRESFVYYGEEKEYCFRLLDGGHDVVYLPDARVLHLLDQSGRSPQRYLRYVTRNDILNALYNEPFQRVIWLVPARLALYFRMRRSWRIHDPNGWRWILAEVAATAADVLRNRKPVGRKTVAHWRRLRAHPSPYDAASTRS